MKTYKIMIALLLLLAAVWSLPVSAAVDPQAIAEDRAKLLTDSERLELEHFLEQLSRKSNCHLAVLIQTETTFYGSDNARTAYMDRLGDEFLQTHGLSKKSPTILFIITRSNGNYYYDLCLYGDAVNKISSKEVDHILDDPTVYRDLKSGELATGLPAAFSLSAKAYTGRVGASYAIIIPISAVIALIIAVLACVGVKTHYSMKLRSVDYPLDRFAKLNLTEHSDIFTGSFVTKRVIQSNSGGRSGGGRSRSGGGHAGGR